MLFQIIKIPARFALRIFCRKIIVNNKNILAQEGPLLIASNHPNSFLDAIILACLFKKPIYSLARGDSFKNKWVTKILLGLNILPVYRLSEGAENLNSNYDTFSKCREIFKKNGIVLIFSEGLCINEWKLRPLKKGTARLAFSSWEEGIDLTILPAGINYHSFTSFGKNVHINFGEPFSWKDFDNKKIDGAIVNEFNQKLKSDLIKLVDHFEKDDMLSLKNKYGVQHASLKKAILYFPSILGKWLHAPLYVPIQKWSWKTVGKHDHYDSVLVGLLFLLYPIYLSLIALLIYFFVGNLFWMIPFAVLPFLAWSFVQLKKDF